MADPNKIAKMQEIVNRDLVGQLPPEKQAIIAEAVNRGILKVKGASYTEKGIGEIATEAVASTPESTQRFFGNVYDAVTSPKQTIEALGKTGAGFLAKGKLATMGEPKEQATLEKGYEYDDQGYMEREQEEQAYWSDPERQRGDIEKVAQGTKPIVDYLSKRYTSEEGFKRAIAQDPIGVIADVASILTGTGSVIKNIPGAAKVGAKIERVGAAIEPVNIARKGTIGLIPKVLPEALYQSAVKFTTGKKMTPRERKSITRLAVDLGINPTQKGLSKAWGAVQNYADQVDNIIKTATDSGATIDALGSIKNIDDLQLQIWSNFPEPQPYMAALEKLKSNIMGAHNKPKSAIAAQELKQGIYEEIAKYYDPSRGGVTGPAAAKIKGKKVVASFLREQLELIHPEIKSLNAKEGSLLKLIEALEQPVKRIENRDIFSIGLPIKTAAGAAVGGATGAGMGTLLGLLDTPGIKSKLAITLEQARKIGRMKDKSVKGRLALRAAGEGMDNETEQQLAP